jgi:chitinase
MVFLKCPIASKKSSPEQSIAEKGAYLKAKGLGGVIQWELNEGYLSSAAAGHRNPLLIAIRDSVLQ